MVSQVRSVLTKYKPTVYTLVFGNLNIEMYRYDSWKNETKDTLAFYVHILILHV